MAVEFSHPWMLALLIPAGFGIWYLLNGENRIGRRKNRWVPVIRAAVILLIVLALAGFHLLLPSRDRTVVFVVDRSASVGDPEEALKFMEEAVRTKRPGDRVAVVSVGATAAVEQAPRTDPDLPALSSVIGEHATDLAAGLRLAGGLVPDDSPGAVVVLSDGLETDGVALKEAEHLRRRGIRVDVRQIGAKSGPEAWMESVETAGTVYEGDTVDIRVKTGSTGRMSATIRLYAGDRPVGERRVILQPGHQTFSFAVKAEESGWKRFRAELVPDADGIPVNNEGFALTRVEGTPRVVIAEGKPGSGRNAAAALRATGMRVDVIPARALPEHPEGYADIQSLIMANVPAEVVPERKMEGIRRAVRDLGMGLVMTGGDQGFALGGWFRTPVEEALPVRTEVTDKKRFPPMAMILVMDKSGSMAGEKLEMAKEAAVRATGMLTPQDRLGVIAFDATWRWLITPQAVTDKATVQSRIGTMGADGGTAIYPALEEAWKSIRTQPVKRKHILLLTDGQSPEGDYRGLVSRMKRDGITLSTVAVGTDAAQGLLAGLASETGGRHYTAESPGAIPTIFAKEAALATRSYVVDKPFVPERTGGADWKELTEPVPPLQAYVATTIKRTAETVLVSPEGDPVMARWQYGLGRAVAWTSDLEGKWSSRWITWNRFAAVWNQVVGWTFPRSGAGGFTVERKREDGRSVLRFIASEERASGIDRIRFRVTDERGTVREGVAEWVEPGVFEGEFPENRPGAFLVRASGEGKKREELGTFGVVVPVAAEFRPDVDGKRLLDAMAAVAGGKSSVRPEEVFAGEWESRYESRDLSWWCLLLATLLWPLDAAVRKWSLTAEELRNRLRLPLVRRDPGSGETDDRWKRISEKTRRETAKRAALFTPSESSPSADHLKRSESPPAQRSEPTRRTVGPPPEKEPVRPPEPGSHLNRLLEAKKRAGKQGKSS
ncbi:VWA domain-containing protein [Staphylospora marina]|uniref:VWA domain-containing protein n=1 Tax=Staphylospora marina TaxID=2490858 RepID=UPI0013DE2407|nr:VWA domain-containing protein [Staphylospora marina]